MTYPLKNSYLGFYRALVIDNADPEFQGRVKVRIPDLMVSDEKHVGKWKENGLWVRPGNTALGGRNWKDWKGEGDRLKGTFSAYQGQCLIPTPGSHVWVWFEKGNPSYGYYGNSADYGQNTVLPENQLGKQPYFKWTLFKSPDGRAIVVSDDGSDARMEITGKKREMLKVNEDNPWGDPNTVYTIDGNQSTFLIDERQDNEKILLRDYRGNFIKISQHEKIDGKDNEFTEDQLHIFMHDDIHIKTPKNFYLTANEIHIMAYKDIFVTASNNIFIHALQQLKEQAQSIDRFSHTYDNTQAANINLNSTGNVNIKAAQDFFVESMNTIRKCLNLTDSCTGIYSATAGVGMGLTSAGPLNLVGDPCTAQTAPITLDMLGATDSAQPTKDCTVANPQGNRNQKVEFITGAPKVPDFQTPDSLKAGNFDPIKIKTSQKPDAQPNSQPGDPPNNNSGFNNSNNSDAQNSGTNASPNINSQDSETFGDSSSSKTESTKPTASEEVDKAIEFATENIKNTDKVIEDTTEEANEFTSFAENSYQEDDTKYTMSSKVDPAANEFKDTLDNFTQTVNQTPIAKQIGADTDNISGTVLGKVFDVLQSTADLIDDMTIPITSHINQFTRDIVGKDDFYITQLRKELPSICVGSFAEYGIYQTWSDLEYKYRDLTWSNIFENLDNDYEYDYHDLIRHNIIERMSSSCSIASNRLISSFGSKPSDCNYSIIEASRIHCENAIKEYSNELSKTLADSINRNNDKIRKEIRDNSKVTIPEDINLCTNEKLKDSIEECKKQVDDYCKKVKDVDTYKDSDNPKEVIKGYSDELKETCISTLSYSTMTRDEVHELETKIDNSIADMLIDDLSALLALASNEVKLKEFKTSIEHEHSFSETLVTENEANWNDLQQKVRDYCGEKYYQKINESIDLDSQIETVVEKIKLFKDGKIKESIVKDCLTSIFDNITIELSNESRYLIQHVVNMDDLLGIVNSFLDDEDRYAEQFDQSVKDFWNSKIVEIAEDVQEERKQIVIGTFKEPPRVDNEFSKYDDKSNYKIPNNIGNGYEYLLFLKEKYRNTIIPLIIKSGGNVLSFSIIRDVDKINENEELIDQVAVDSYKRNFSDETNEPEENALRERWWDNLRQILNQADIMGMTVCINLMDFTDTNNPFIKDIDESKRYTQENWSDDIQGAFFDKLFTVTKDYNCNIVYNIGYGCYKVDPEAKDYKIYPTCSYLRKLIMYFAYKSKVTSNMLALTANSDQNLYYYNPYCEWYSYDDNRNHYLKNCEVISRDFVDGLSNDNADIVKYQSNVINGGYANIIVNSSTYSLPIFSMQNLSEHILPGMDVTDPNIMNQIFCRKSREAIRFFKTTDYQTNTGDIEFDENGEVII